MEGRYSAFPQETICDHQSESGPIVTHVRGSLLASSLETLKQAGHYERYLPALNPAVRETVLYALAHSWVPIDVALEHYRACDALGLGDADFERIGNLVAERMTSTFLSTVLRAARNAGVDGPFIALRAQGRIWDRVYVGGAVRVTRTGPKDATAEFYGLPLTQIPYFRQAYCAYYRGLAEMVVRQAYISLVRPSDGQPTTLALRGSWA